MTSRITAAFVHELNKKITGNAAAQIIQPNGLASALARPQQQEHYVPNSKPAKLAATLAYGIIMNHPFMDGNKRTAFEAANAGSR